jgi:hypothetical protein
MTRQELIEDLMSSRVCARLEDLRRQYNGGKLHGLVAFAFDGCQTRMLTAGCNDEKSMANWFRLLAKAYGDNEASDGEDVIGIAA